MSQQLDIFGRAPSPTPAPGLPPGTHYHCPCCGSPVTDEYVEGDALCCWCRDIDDPRLSDRVRERRQRDGRERLCCQARLAGRERRYVTPPICGAYDVRRPEDIRQPAVTT